MIVVDLAKVWSEADFKIKRAHEYSLDGAVTKKHSNMGTPEKNDQLKGLIAPSVLASDFSALGDESEKVLKFGADWLHLDVMDGNFVPNISFGFPVIKSLSKRLPDAYKDTHLMVAKPQQWVEKFTILFAKNARFK